MSEAENIMEKEVIDINKDSNGSIDHDLFRKRNEEKEKIKNEVKEKYPGKQLFVLTLPYSGTYVIKCQDMSDVKEAAKIVDDFFKKKIEDFGGPDAFQQLPESERILKHNEINTEAGDISNEIALKRCVLYPYDFAERVDSGKDIPAGAIGILLDKIYEVSGFQDEVQIEEI